MTETSIVCNDKGGVGKSLVTASLASFFAEENGRWPNVIEVDHARLHKTLGRDVVTLTVPPGTDAAQLVNEPEAARELFNPIYEPMTCAASVVDIGANALTPFFNWAEYLPLAELLQGEGVVPVFVFVAGPNPDALVGVVNAYERARALFGDRARYAFVLNDVDGSGFVQFNDREVRAYIDRASENGAARVVELPNCACRLARWASSRDALPLQALENFERAAQELGLTRPARAQQWNHLTRWVGQARAALQPLVPACNG